MMDGVSLFGLGFGLERGRLCCCRSCCGVGGCVGWCWCCCSWWWLWYCCCSWGCRSVSGLGLGSDCFVGVWFEVEEDLVPEMQGHRCRGGGGLPGVLPGCLGRLCGGTGASGSLVCGCSFAFGLGFVDEVGREGGVRG